MLIFAGWARRGGRYPAGAPTVAVGAARRLRCDARIARAAAVPLSSALNAPRTSRRPRRSAASGGLPLAPLRFSPRHKSPPADTAHRVVTLVAFDDARCGGAGKAGGGCAPAETYAAPRSAGLRRLRVALRRRAGHTLFELRAQRRCAAASRPREGEFVWPPSPPEHRWAAGLRRAVAFERRRIPAHGLASRETWQSDTVTAPTSTMESSL
jgi:hypothetical protein